MNNEVVSVSELTEKAHLKEQEWISALTQLLGAMVKIAFLESKLTISYVFDYTTNMFVIDEVLKHFKNLGYDVQLEGTEGPGFTLEYKITIHWKYIR